MCMQSLHDCATLLLSLALGPACCPLQQPRRSSSMRCKGCKMTPAHAWPHLQGCLGLPETSCLSLQSNRGCVDSHGILHACVTAKDVGQMLQGLLQLIKSVCPASCLQHSR